MLEQFKPVPRRAIISKPNDRAGQEPPGQRQHIQPLNAQHLVCLMEGELSSDTILNTAHSAEEPESPPGILKRFARNIRMKPPPPAGKVWLTATTINYQYPHECGIIILQHVHYAEAAGGGIDVVLGGNTIHLPRLCRTRPLVNTINAILTGAYDPALPFRPSCRTCRHQANNVCAAQPPPITQSACCSRTAHLDWCSAYRPNIRS